VPTGQNVDDVGPGHIEAAGNVARAVAPGKGTYLPYISIAEPAPVGVVRDLVLAVLFCRTDGKILDGIVAGIAIKVPDDLVPPKRSACRCGHHQPVRQPVLSADVKS
jgi:hypothetical protein